MTCAHRQLNQLHTGPKPACAWFLKTNFMWDIGIFANVRPFLGLLITKDMIWILYDCLNNTCCQFKALAVYAFYGRGQNTKVLLY